VARLPRSIAIIMEGSMKLGELKQVKDALKIPVLLWTNRLRFGECRDEEEVERTVWELARAITRHYQA
jgi:hypothetical protein